MLFLVLECPAAAGLQDSECWSLNLLDEVCVSLHLLRQLTFCFEAFLSRRKVCVPVIKPLRAPNESLV